MQNFYDVELASGDGIDFVYLSFHFDAYIEPMELTALATDGSNPAWADRIEFIRPILVR